jgi:hypothetical protein
MTREPFIITFPDTSRAEANQYASDLAATLRDLPGGIVVEQRRDREDTQDFGATLAVVLGTASATAIAQGVAAWLKRHSGASITINRDGEVTGNNLNSQDAARIAEAFSRHA